MKYKIEPEKTSYIGTEDMKKDCRVLVGLPVYGGNIEMDTAGSLIELAQLAVKANVHIDFFYLTRESLIPRGRNKIVAHFLSSHHNYTHLMSIDADTKFDAHDVFKMLHYNKDIISGAVSVKTRPIRYVIDIKQSVDFTTSKTRMNVSADKKLVELERCGSAFFLAKRRVFEEMIKAFPELHADACDFPPEVMRQIKKMKSITNEEKYSKDMLDNFYTLFDTGTAKELKLACIEDPNKHRKNAYLSEDYVFIERWKSIGGRIWLDPRIKLGHIGKTTYEGNCMKLFPEQLWLAEDYEWDKKNPTID